MNCIGRTLREIRHSNAVLLLVLLGQICMWVGGRISALGMHCIDKSSEIENRGTA